ncbi:flavodoxin domain-containing protein [Geodermatophilus sp. CPCC 205761]|uniref:flavodoxin domain-containing protein n=1 Tax=Geodermatophilus sp. CPCC 205761 TaxID=2936597 RepID=UPI003EEEE9FF
MTTAGLRVLVTAASRHGSTHEIAAALARDLNGCATGRTLGLVASAVPAENRPDPSMYQAVALGSAVYAGRWLEAARDLATAHLVALRDRPVWLFSSGPIGAPPFPPDEPHDAGTFATMLDAVGHRVFPGRLDKGLLSFGERAMVTAMRAPVGDFRDWELVRSWAEEIAATLADRTTPLAAPEPRGT